MFDILLGGLWYFSFPSCPGMQFLLMTRKVQPYSVIGKVSLICCYRLHDQHLSIQLELELLYQAVLPRIDYYRLYHREYQSPHSQHGLERAERAERNCCDGHRLNRRFSQSGMREGTFDNERVRRDIIKEAKRFHNGLHVVGGRSKRTHRVMKYAGCFFKLLNSQKIHQHNSKRKSTVWCMRRCTNSNKTS